MRTRFNSVPDSKPILDSLKSLQHVLIVGMQPIEATTDLGHVEFEFSLRHQAIDLRSETIEVGLYHLAVKRLHQRIE